MNIAVIGTTKIAQDYAIGFALAGHEVFLAKKENDEEWANRHVLQSFENITFCSIENAASISDLAFVATLKKDVREVSYWLGDVRRKVIIDLTANVNEPDDEMLNTVSAIKAITGSQHIVKAFDAKGYEQLLKPIFKSHHIDLMLAGDSKKAKEITKILCAEMGILHFLDFGGDETIPLFTEMTKCWHGLLATHAKVQNVKVIESPGGEA
jgi:predicted dinucleotide-binding enzyme